jgi:hypothetical protein
MWSWRLPLRFQRKVQEARQCVAGQRACMKPLRGAVKVKLKIGFWRCQEYGTSVKEHKWSQPKREVWAINGKAVE